MIRVWKTVASAFAVAGLLAAAAVTARAQEGEENDRVKKTDKSEQQGKITAEDVKGIKITVGKAGIGIDWKSIKSIEYSGAGWSSLRQAMGSVDSGAIADAIAQLEKLRKEEIRPLLKPHVLNLLGFCYLRNGEFDKSIQAFDEMFKIAPQTQFLVKGGGANLVNAYLGKGDAAGAAAALDTLKKAVSDPAALNLLSATVQEAGGDFAGAAGSYKAVMDAASDDATKGAAELGVARCLAGQKKTAEAEAKYRGLVSRDLPPLVLAGAWNGIGDIMYDDAAAKHNSDTMYDALYAYLRGCVLYLPGSGESTSEQERALYGAYKCFKGLSEIETKDKEKRNLMKQAGERLDLLRQKFPNSPYLRGK